MTGPFGTTPGEWRFSMMGEYPIIECVTDHIANVSVWQPQYHAERDANARAIAQVPAMLELVRLVLLDAATDEQANMARAIVAKLEEK